MPRKALIAFDPGETTGIALINLDESGNFVSIEAMTQVSHKDQISWFAEFNRTYPDLEIVEVVYELWITYRQHAQRQIGSKQITSQVIGQIKMWANMRGVPDNKIVAQKASILPVARKWSGVVGPKQHSQSHRFDAFNHGYYYLYSEDRVPSGDNNITPILKENADV